MHEAVSNTPSHLGLAPHDSSCYAKCMFGGVLACGLTHAGITPFEIAFVSPFCSHRHHGATPHPMPAPMFCPPIRLGARGKGHSRSERRYLCFGVMMLFRMWMRCSTGPTRSRSLSLPLPMMLGWLRTSHRGTTMILCLCSHPHNLNLPLTYCHTRPGHFNLLTPSKLAPRRRHTYRPEPRRTPPSTDVKTVT